MKLLLRRKFKGETYTIGDLYIDGEFFCNTLEDKVRDLPLLCYDTPQGINCKCKEKVYAETAIPCGTYKVTISHSPRFKRKLPRLHDVPHFLGILIHNGNHKEHSSGCILVGNNRVKGMVLESMATMKKLMVILNKESDIEIVIV